MGRGRLTRVHLLESAPVLTALTACLAFALLAHSGSAQAPLRHDVTVTLKLIQVYVTGPGGKPALGLERTDFTLTDNGRPQTITEFESRSLAVPAAERPVAAALPAPVPMPGGVAAGGRPLLARKFVFLIDYVRNVFEGVQKAKAAALDFLETKVAPDDEVALYTLSPISGLTLYEHFTTDHDKVRAKVKRLREFVGGGASFAGDELTGMELMNAQVFAGHGGHAGPSQRNIFEEIAAWAKALRAVPGQKNVILFTMGFGNGVVRPGRLTNVLFEAMARALASANAPVFTVDTTPQNVPGRDIEARLPSGTLAERSLDYLSKTTGGMYLGGVDHSARIAGALQDATANYYVLGYSVPAAWDGKYHEVKVEVRKPGYAVHAQGGYYNPVPFAELSPIEKHIQLIETALAAGSAGSKAASFPLIARPFDRAGRPNTLLLAEIPAEVRGSVGERVELVSLILGPDSAIVDGKRVELGPADLGPSGVLEYSTAALAPGRYECRSVLRNLDDGRAAAGSCPVEIAATPGDAAIIFPPLFLVRGPEAHYLNLASPGTAGGLPSPALSAIFPFPAKDYVPLVGPLEAGRTALFASLRCLWGGRRTGAGRELAARIVPEGSDEGEPVEMTLLASISQEAADVYLLELELPELAPGRYRIEITGTDAADGAVIRTEGALAIAAGLICVRDGRS